MNRYKAVKIYGKKFDEHRVIARAEMLGFNIIVHHIDGDKSNNMPENLEIMTRTEHCQKHGLGREIRSASMLIFAPSDNHTGICRKCGQELPWDCFPSDKNATYGKRSACKVCTAMAKKAWRLRAGS